VQELRFLYGIGRSVTSLQSLEQVLNRIVEAAVYLTGAEEGSIMLLDESSGDLYLRAARGMGEKNAKTSRLKVQDSIAGQVVRTGRPVMIGGANQDDSFKITTGHFVKALLNVPLKVTDRVIGVLAVNNKRRVQEFSERHLNLLLALADYASIAIENARLYARLSLHADQAKQSTRELEQTVKARTSQLQQINQQLIRTEKVAALGYMAAGVAKEINSPIDTILQNLRRLNNKEALSAAEQLQLVAVMEQQAARCQNIIQSLLDFSGQRNYKPRQINLNDVVEQAWSKYGQENELNNHIKFVRGFDPQLPPVMVDPQQMEQALFYLLRHAYEAMPQGGTLRVTSRSVGADVQIIVSDTGQGISPEDMRHIFDPFYETNGHNYGLDLSITYAIIGRHNGKIEVESEMGQGTTFTIHLPHEA
jgi:two-component system NtrC family sensor kinase